MGLDKISEYKKRMGLTNEELSKLSGVPKGTLDKILSGVTKDPKLNTLKSLAKVFNCTLDDFDDDKTEKKFDTLNLSKEENQHILDFRLLNDIGRKKVVTYTKDLLDNLKYQKDDEISATLHVAEERATYNETNKDNKNNIYTFAAHDDELTDEESARIKNQAKLIFEQMDKE